MESKDVVVACLAVLLNVAASSCGRLARDDVENATERGSAPQVTPQPTQAPTPTLSPAPRPSIRGSTVTSTEPSNEEASLDVTATAVAADLTATATAISERARIQQQMEKIEADYAGYEPPSDQFVIAASLKELVDRSTVVVIGTVGIRTPDTYWLVDNQSYGSVYHLDVDRYLKGTAGETIGVFDYEMAVTRDDDVISFNRPPFQNPLTRGVRYLLFLKPYSDRPELLRRIRFEPASFHLAAGVARAVHPIGVVSASFPTSREADLTAQIEAIVKGANATTTTPAR